MNKIISQGKREEEENDSNILSSFNHSVPLIVLFVKRKKEEGKKYFRRILFEFHHENIWKISDSPQFGKFQENGQYRL